MCLINFPTTSSRPQISNALSYSHNLLNFRFICQIRNLRLSPSKGKQLKRANLKFPRINQGSQYGPNYFLRILAVVQRRILQTSRGMLRVMRLTILLRDQVPVTNSPPPINQSTRMSSSDENVRKSRCLSKSSMISKYPSLKNSYLENYSGYNLNLSIMVFISFSTRNLWLSSWISSQRYILLSSAVSKRQCEGTALGNSQRMMGRDSSAKGTTRITEYGINLSRSILILLLWKSSNPVKYSGCFLRQSAVIHCASSQRSLEPWTMVYLASLRMNLSLSMIVFYRSENNFCLTSSIFLWSKIEQQLRCPSPPARILLRLLDNILKIYQDYSNLQANVNNYSWQIQLHLLWRLRLSNNQRASIKPNINSIFIISSIALLKNFTANSLNNNQQQCFYPSQPNNKCKMIIFLSTEPAYKSNQINKFICSIEYHCLVTNANNFNTMKVGEQLQKGHILKFVHNGRTFNPHVGIKTFPKQTYGVSQQSPEEFQQQHTLLGEHGYIYQYENAKQFQYPSQRNYFNVHTCEEKGTLSKLPARFAENSLAFHRKKGRLSQFMDKNGWMSPVMPLMGFQRTENARNLSNRDRQNRISSLKPKINYQNPTQVKPIPNQQYFNTISVLMSERVRIRKKRQDLMKSQVPATPRVIAQKQSQANPLHLENIEERMAKTTKDFYSTRSTFYNSREASYFKQRQISSRKTNLNSRQFNRQQSLISSPNKSRRQASPDANYRTISPSKVSRTVELKKITEDDIMAAEDLKLQDWYRNSCHSKWDYKPKKIDSQQQQQQLYVSVPL